jgi:ribonuclease E
VAAEPKATQVRDSAPEQSLSTSEAKSKRRKRGSRGGRRRHRESVETRHEGIAAVEIEAIPGEVDDFPDLHAPADQAELVAKSPDGGKRESTRSRSKKTAGHQTQRKARKTQASEPAKGVRVRGSKTSAAAPLKKRKIIVNAADPEETRVAVVEEGRIVDLQMSVKKHVSYVSDIYRGRVVNLEPAIGAAFVDFGQGRNGFLHASDVLSCYGDDDWSLEKLLSTPTASEEWSDDGKPAAQGGEDGEGGEEEEAPRERRQERGKRTRSSHSRSSGSKGRPKRVRLPIDRLIKKGQMVCVQITKDAIGDKGPTLTTYISIPGRYLVLMPSLERTGVSRKIEDERERRRLKRILSSMKIPEGMGVIVRTAGVGRTKIELRRDLEYLLLAWEDFSKRLVSGRNPLPLYQESDVAILTMRDLFTAETTESVIVDDEEVFRRMGDFTKKLMPEHIDRIVLHEGLRPIFHTHAIEQDFEKIFARRVELPSGGSIVIDQTEALVAIDVNSGRTRAAGAEFEDIALKTNLEAVPEIARQIRLRDLGGIIVLDYIDMMRSSSRRAVERATRECVRSDRARSKIGRISQFGLLELTRQRLGPGLNKLVYDTCIRCRGSGRRRNAASRAQAILRRLGASLTLKGFSTVEVRGHPEVVDYLDIELNAEMGRLEEKSGRKLVLVAAPDQVEDSVLHYLRADGREVRPGGRRKK